MPAMPMADSSAADGRRDQRDEQRHQHRRRRSRCRNRRRARQGHHRDQEDDGQAGQQDGQRDLVRRLLPLGAFDQGDHPIEEGRARREVMRTMIQSDTTVVPPVTAERSPPALTDHGRGLAGDGRLVDRGDALDDFAVAGDHVTGLDQHDIARPAARGRDGLIEARSFRRSTSRLARGLGARRCARCRPAPSRALRRWLRRSWRTAP